MVVFRFYPNALCLYFVILTSISACSSGGSSGGGSSGGYDDSGGLNSNFSVNINPSSFNITATAPKQSQTLIIVGEGVGDPGVDTLFIDAKFDETIFRNAILYQESNGLRVNIETHPELWGGVYTGSITLYACADAQCRRQLADSPWSIPFSIAVPKSSLRFEPINYDEDVVIEYGDDYIVVSVDSGSTGVAIDYKTEIDSSLAAFALPEALINNLKPSNISKTGFTLNTPMLADGNYVYDYDLTFTGGAGISVPFTVYYFVGRTEGVENKIITFDDSITSTALFADPSLTLGKSRYLATGLEPGILDPILIDVEYLDGDAWVESTSSYDGYLSVTFSAKDLALGTYRAKLNLSTHHSQLLGSIDVLFTVVHGIKLNANSVTKNLIFDLTLYDGVNSVIDVQSTLGVEGTWTASSDNSIVDLIKNTGHFTEGAYDPNAQFQQDELVFSPNSEVLEIVANGTTQSVNIRVSADDKSVPDGLITYTISKMIPEITKVSQSQFIRDEPITIDVEGVFLNQVEDRDLSLYLPNVIFNSGFTIEQTSHTDTFMRLSHPGVDTEGSYELMIYKNFFPLVQRQTIIITSP